MTTIIERAASPALYDRSARRSGQVHYVTFVPRGEMIEVEVDDCNMSRSEVITKDAARIEWRAWIARGFVRHH